MAQFELRIYSLPIDILEGFEEDHERYITEEEFIELAEEEGTIQTLANLFTTGGIIETRVNTYRAYLINVNNTEAEPIRVDYYNTILEVSEVLKENKIATAILGDDNLHEVIYKES